MKEERVIFVIIASILTMLAVFYWCVAAWVQWGTPEPGYWNPPDVICLQSAVWTILAGVFWLDKSPRKAMK